MADFQINSFCVSFSLFIYFCNQISFNRVATKIDFRVHMMDPIPGLGSIICYIPSVSHSAQTSEFIFGLPREIQALDPHMIHVLCVSKCESLSPDHMSSTKLDHEISQLAKQHACRPRPALLLRVGRRQYEMGMGSHRLGPILLGGNDIPRRSVSSLIYKTYKISFH